MDGTITKSDVLGHLMPRVGYDWSHLGVTAFYSRIAANGYASRSQFTYDLGEGYLRRRALF